MSRSVTKSVFRCVHRPTNVPAAMLGGVPVLTPPTGMSIWLKAGAESYSNGANVTQWSDQSGNARHATAASNYPTFATNANGTKSAIAFNGTNQGFTLSRTGSGTAYTISGIVKSNVDALKVWWQNGTDPYFGQNSGMRPIFFRGASASLTPTDFYQHWMPVTIWVSGTTAKLYVGKLLAATATVTSGAMVVAGIGNLASFFWSGWMQEIVAYESALNDANLKSLINYMYQESLLTDQVIVSCDGDSLTAGVGSSNPSTLSYPAQLQTSLGSSYLVRNLGVSGQTIVNAGAPSGFMNSDAASQVHYYGGRAGGKNVTVVWGGTNDLYFGRTGAQAATDFLAYCSTAKASGAYVIAMNMIDRTTVGGSWTQQGRTTFNANVAAGSSNYDVLIDVSSQFNDCTDTNKFNGDQTHLTDASYTTISGLVKSAIESAASTIG